MTIIEGEFPKDKNINDMIKAINNLKELLPYQIQLVGLVAQVHRSYYESLIKSGFSKKEALELTKTRI